MGEFVEMLTQRVGFERTVTSELRFELIAGNLNRPSVAEQVAKGKLAAPIADMFNDVFKQLVPNHSNISQLIYIQKHIATLLN